MNSAMNKVISMSEKDEQKLPEDQKHVLITEMNGEFEGLGESVAIETCEPPKETGKATSVSEALKTVVKYGFRTSEFGSTTGHCYKPPRSSTKKIDEHEIEAEDVNDAKQTFRYGNQDKADVSMDVLGTNTYMVKGFRDTEGLEKLDQVFGYNESSRAGYDMYYKDSPMTKKTQAGYTSLNQI